LAMGTTGGIVVNEQGTVVTHHKKCENAYVYDL